MILTIIINSYLLCNKYKNKDWQMKHRQMMSGHFTITKFMVILLLSLFFTVIIGKQHHRML